MFARYGYEDKCGLKIKVANRNGEMVFLWSDEGKDVESEFE